MRTFHFLVVAILLSAVSLSSAHAECPDCSRYANGALLRDPEDCARYYKCVNGRAERNSCGRGYYFDERYLICNFAAFVDCRSGAEETTTEVPCTTEPPCKSTTCRTTTSCSTTTCRPTTPSTPRNEPCKTVTTTCTTPRNRPNQHVTTTCATPRKEPCKTATTPCTTPRTPCVTEAPTGELPAILQHRSDCRTLKDGTYLLDGKHCRRYYVCLKGKAKHERCSQGLWFDGLSKTCKRPEEVTCCPANRN